MRFCLILYIIFSISFFLQAQSDSIRYIKPDKNYFKSYFTDGGKLLVSPAKWNTKEWCGFAGFTATTLIAINYDKDIYNFFDKQKNSLNDNLSKYGLEPWGSGIYSLSAMGILYAHGALFDNNRSRQTALLGTKAFVYSCILVQIPKYLFNRHRPYHDIPPNPVIWEGPFSGTYYKSFFSGHTTCVFSVATVVASLYHDKPYVPVICYSIASLTGLSRIYDQKHWSSDVIAGAFLGYAIGKFVYRENTGKNINVLPYTDGKTSGISLIIPLNK